MEGAPLESAQWRCVEAMPAIGFTLEGRAAARARERAATSKTSIATAEGRVASVGDGRLWLVEDGQPLREAFALKFSLPREVDLGALVGERVHVTLCNEPLAGGPMRQLLTLTDHTGRVRMIAHHGTAQGNVHALGATQLRASLSQRAGGPMVFGTSHLQCVVFAGEKVVINDGANAFVMHLVARTAAGNAAYVIVERSLWDDGRRR